MHMKLLCIGLFIVYQIGLLPIVANEEQAITILTGKDVEKKVLSSKDVWLIGASMNDQQGDSEEFMTTLGNVFSKLIPYGIKVGFVDCKLKSNTKQCQNISPILTTQKLSLMLFVDTPQPNPYTKKYYRKPEFYTSPNADAKAIEKFILKTYNPSNFKLIDKATINTVDDDIASLKDGTKPTLVVFAEQGKSFKSIIYKAVAHNFTNALDVLAYRSSKPIESSSLDIQEKTTVYLIRPDKKEAVLYDGDSSNTFDISQWISQYIQVAETLNDEIDDIDLEDNQIKIISAVYSNSNFTESSVSLDEEWIVAVLKSGDESGIKGWTKIERSTGGVVKPAKLYCETDSTDGTLGSKLCSQGSNDYIVVIPYGAAARKKFYNSDINKWTTYSISSLSSAVKAIGSSLPEHAVETISESLFQEVLKRTITQQRLPSFYIPKPSDELIIPASIIHVALSTSKYIELVVVSNPSKKFLAEIGGHAPPFIITMLPEPAGDNLEHVGLKPVIYDPSFHGAFTYPRLSLFFRRTFLSSIFGQSKAADDLFKEDTVTSTVKVSIQEVTDNSTWTKACPSSYRGLCVIYLTSKESGYSESILNAIANDNSREGALASSVQLIHIDGECKLSFLESFGISTINLPTVVVYAPFKERYTIFRGSLSETSIVEFVSSILIGKTSTIAISHRPVVNEGCAIVEEVADVIEEDASDFLAEILAEEKAKAEAVKQAAAEELKKLEQKKQSKSEKKDKKKKKSKKSKQKKESDEEEL